MTTLYVYDDVATCTLIATVTGPNEHIAAKVAYARFPGSFRTDSPDLTARKSDDHQAIVATPEEAIAELVRQWKADSCWDLEDSEGFEEYRDQLKKIADEQNKVWEQQRQVREKAELRQSFIEFREKHLHDFAKAAMASKAGSPESRHGWDLYDQAESLVREAFKRTQQPAVDTAADAMMKEMGL